VTQIIVYPPNNRVNNSKLALQTNRVNNSKLAVAPRELQPQVVAHRQVTSNVPNVI